MAVIKSNTVAVQASDATIFEFLTDLNNLHALMPDDRIKDWTSDKETCSFQIKGLAKIGMRLENTTPHSNIHIVSHGKNPFEFSLDINMNSTGEGSCEGQLVFDGKMNSFLEMMASKPLTNFFNMLANNLQARYA